MIELKFKRKTGWDGPDLDRGAERRAADLSLKVLKELEQVFLQAFETQKSPDWIYDLGGIDPQSAAFLLHSLGKGEVRISLHNAEVKVCETAIPGLWLLEIGQVKSLVAALLPRSIEAAISSGADRIEIPEKLPAGLFAAPAILGKSTTHSRKPTFPRPIPTRCRARLTWCASRSRPPTAPSF